MDIRILSTGRVFFQVDPTLCAILLEMFPGNVERLAAQPKPEPASATPVWGVGTDAGSFVHIFYRVGANRSMYDGPPDNAVNGFKVRRWSGQKQDYVFEGPEPPPEIVEEYRQRYAPRPFVYHKD